MEKETCVNVSDFDVGLDLMGFNSVKRLLIIISALINLAMTGEASWYSTESCRYNMDPQTCKTASGRSLYVLEKEEKENPNFRFAASWKYPLGAKVKVINLINGKSCVVAILDRGPSRRLGRIIDVSRQAAGDLGFVREGVTQVKVEKVLP